MLKVVSGDLTSLKSKSRFVLVQQVNCQAVMGAGLAKAIKQVWPQVYNDYMAFCNSMPDQHARLGHIQTSVVGDQQFICNVFGQLRYGRHGHYTNERALLYCISRIIKHAEHSSLPVYIPYGIGSGLAGGDRHLIVSTITQLAKKSTGTIYLVKPSTCNL